MAGAGKKNVSGATHLAPYGDYYRDLITLLQNLQMARIELATFRVLG